ncbi:hypothetical protein SALBM311S_04845 [Streptomyces alboniger]
MLYTTGWSRTGSTTSTWGSTSCATVLAERPARVSEETCRVVLDARGPASPATTSLCSWRAPGPWPPTDRRVASVPADPAGGREVRASVCGSCRWGLDELAFAAELILSELVTNAVRYGAGPIRVRVLYDRTLICEVSDSSNTAPHLRRAADDGRGRTRLVPGRAAVEPGALVTHEGKVIWAEQNLPSNP